MYLYYLLRFHISNQYHIRNRINLEKSGEKLLRDRRKLRVISNQPSMFQRIIKYL
jgi:hypothetical protein